MTDEEFVNKFLQPAFQRITFPKSHNNLYIVNNNRWYVCTSSRTPGRDYREARRRDQDDMDDGIDTRARY